MIKKSKIVASFFAICVGALYSSNAYCADGIYKNVKIIPNRLADYCEKSAEDLVKEPKNLSECINKLAAQMMNPDAKVAADAKEVFARIRAEWLADNISKSLVAEATVADMKANESKDSAILAKRGTEQEDNTALMHAIDMYCKRLDLLLAVTADYNASSAMTNLPAVSAEIVKEVGLDSEGNIK